MDLTAPGDRAPQDGALLAVETQLIGRSARLTVRGELDVATAAMAKYWCTDQQVAVIDRCLQLFGGYGYMAEYPIARMYADARVQRIYAGANEVMKELVARAL